MIHTHLREDFRDGDRMGDVSVPGTPHLPIVGKFGVLIRTGYFSDLFFGEVVKVADQAVDGRWRCYVRTSGIFG